MNIKKALMNYFSVKENDSDFRTEVIAGITTFLTMSYIVIVNPSILSAAISLPGYTSDQVLQMLAIVTILSSAVSIFIMAFYANRPFALAPGLGLNAFFAYTVVLTMGIPWQTALAAVFVEGIIFILLTLVGARKYIIKAFPEPVKFSVGTGIGFFLGLIGLQKIGIVVNDEATLVTLGNIASDPVALLSILGLFLTYYLYAKGIRGSIILGIIGTTIAGYALTSVGVVDPGVLAPKSIPAPQYDFTPLIGAFLDGFTNLDAIGFALVVFTFFFVDFFDTAGTLIGVSQVAGFLDENGNLPEMEKPLLADAIGTTFGSMIGTSTVTSYLESAAGVEEGGRTGLTALVVGMLFLISLIFIPLAAGIPQYASHLALVVVAVLMIRNITKVNWGDFTHAVPAAMTIIIMPLTYNIGYGIAAGIITYPIVKIGTGEWRDLNIPQIVLALLFVIYFYVRTGMLA
ncbi:MAG: Xanthine/uracil/vitamin C permease, AzgA family [Candidatus Methanohalarchaeum thermophilum]|uniref:Xanthine/uracil/vitamin C permease, AzgA family n=1 Tax=Methanohalarchaeum thermophilum TaxID=1903181 RepID=A0A1Q6DW72_METT1|nr:MAG: Xanthine/uracil/vitamin C permease, AzgA family [Candidatus Methanohalarchaeum thermophilum]